jgi:hypothetical protein
MEINQCLHKWCYEWALAHDFPKFFIIPSNSCYSVIFDCKGKFLFSCIALKANAVAIKFGAYSPSAVIDMGVIVLISVFLNKLVPQHFRYVDVDLRFPLPLLALAQHYECPRQMLGLWSCPGPSRYALAFVLAPGLTYLLQGDS